MVLLKVWLVRKFLLIKSYRTMWQFDDHFDLFQTFIVTTLLSTIHRWGFYYGLEILLSYYATFVKMLQKVNRGQKRINKVYWTHTLMSVLKKETHFSVFYLNVVCGVIVEEGKILQSCYLQEKQFVGFWGNCPPMTILPIFRIVEPHNTQVSSLA